MPLLAENTTEPRLLCILVKQHKLLVLDKMGTQTPTLKIQKLLAAILLHSGSRHNQVYQVNI